MAKISELVGVMGEDYFSGTMYRIFAFLGPMTVPQMICCCYFIERARMAFSAFNSKTFFFEFQINHEKKEITVDGFEECIVTLPGVRITDDGRVIIEPLLINTHFGVLAPVVSAITDLFQEKVIERDEEHPGYLFDYAVNHDVSDYEAGHLNESEL